MGDRRDFRQGDVAEEDDGIDGVLPPTQVIGSDQKGIKIIIEWHKNDWGVRTKVTKTVHVKKQVKKVNPGAIWRRSLKKFGDGIGQDASDNLTIVSTEEIFLERTTPASAFAEPEKGVNLASLGNALLIVSWTCGKKEDHWTSKCPFKESAATKGARSHQLMTTWEFQGCLQDLEERYHMCYPTCSMEIKLTEERACDVEETTTLFGLQISHKTLASKISRSCFDNLVPSLVFT